MKVLKSTKEYFALLGIIPAQSNQKHPFNLRNGIVYTLFGSCAMFSLIFLIFKADTFVDFSTSFYTTNAVFVNAAYFSIFVWKMSDLFEVVQTLENFIEESE